MHCKVQMPTLGQFLYSPFRAMYLGRQNPGWPLAERRDRGLNYAAPLFRHLNYRQCSCAAYLSAYGTFAPEPSLRSGSRLHIEPMLDASSSRPIFCEGAPPRSSPCPDHDPALYGAAAGPSECWATAASAERLVARRRARPNLAGCGASLK